MATELRPTKQGSGPKFSPPVNRIPSPLARRFHQICNAVLAESLAGENLVPLEYAVFAYLEAEPGIDQNGLAARIGIDANNVSLILEQLEGRGLVERIVNPADRRARMLRLTPQAIELRQRVRPAALAAQAQILAPLAPAERELFLDFLVRVIEGNEGYARPGAGRRKRRAPSRATEAVG